MKVLYEYLKRDESRENRISGYTEYKKKMDTLSKSLPLNIIDSISTGFMINTKHGIFKVGAGNTKVKFPTMNFEAGLTCSSSKECKFSFIVKRAGKSKSRLCYAQKLEGARPAMFNAKIYQAEVAERIATRATIKEQKEIVELIVEATRYVTNQKYVRFSEVGDIGPTVGKFANRVIKGLVEGGFKPYLYTKRPEKERKAFRAAGATVVISEEDFVVVKNEEEAKAIGLPVCPGVCGGYKGCFRCPLGKKSAVIAH